MLISSRRRPTDEDLAAQILTQKPEAILQAAKEKGSPALAPAPLASGSPTGGVRIGPRPVEELPGEQPRTSLKIAPRTNPTPPAVGSAPPDPVPLTSPVPSTTSPAAPVASSTYEPPPPGSVQEAQEQLNEASGRVVKDKNGRLVSILKNALFAAGQPFQDGHVARDWNELAGAAGRGIGGGIVGGIKPSIDEERGKQFDITKGQGELDRRTKNEANRAQIRFTNANAAKAENYEEIEQRKADERAKKDGATALNRERNAVFAALRLRKDTGIDPNSPADAALLQQAARVGAMIDVKSFNKSKANILHIELVDPDNPTQKQHVEFNRVTGEVKTVGQSGYVQPVGADGMTEAQRRSDSDRDASREQRAEQFKQTFGLGVDKYKLQVERGLKSDARAAFGIETRGHFERGRAIEKQIADLERRKAENLIRKGDADEQISSLQAEALELNTEIETARSKALGGLSSGSRPAAGGAYAGQKFARSKLESVRSKFGGKSVEEIERIITQNGGTVY